MTEEERKVVLNDYLSTCAKIGEATLNIELSTKDIVGLKEKASELLKQLKASEKK